MKAIWKKYTQQKYYHVVESFGKQNFYFTDQQDAYICIETMYY